MGSATLASLPTEVLALIFGHFCLHCRGEHDQPRDIGTVQQRQVQFRQQSDAQKRSERSWYYLLYRLPLCSLSRVSTRFRDIAQPILHHEFVHGHGDSWDSTGFNWERRLLLFMRTVKQRPDLARRTKVVGIHWFLFKSLGQTTETLKQCATAMGVNLRNVWRDRAVRFASFTDDKAHKVPLFMSFLVSFLDGEHGLDLAGLQNIGCELALVHDTEHCWMASELLALLLAQLPNLEHLSTQDFDDKLGLFPALALLALNVSRLPLKTLDVDIRPAPIIGLASGLETLNIRGNWRRQLEVPPMPNLKVLRVTGTTLPEISNQHGEKGPAQLTDLPNETLILILSHFCLHCSGEHDQPYDIGTLQQHEVQRQKRRSEQDQNAKSWYSLDRHSLFSLCLASRRLRDLAQPILYHEFILGYGDSWRSHKYSWEGRLTSFMRTMAQRRDLASHVSRASVHLRLLQPVSTDEARSILRTCADALGINISKAWSQRKSSMFANEWSSPGFEGFLASFFEGHDVLQPRVRASFARHFEHPWSRGSRWIAIELVAMLIAQLPNLEHLSIQHNFTWTNEQLEIGPFPPTALAALNVSRLSLKSLDVDILATPIVELATGLETLNLHLCAFPSPMPPMPNLKVLRVIRVTLDENNLKKLLGSRTGGLRTFVYEAARDLPNKEDLSRRGVFQLSLRHFVEYLHRHRDTLTSLHLDLRAENIWDHGQYTHVKDSLRGFTVLKNLLLSSNAIPLPRRHEDEQYDCRSLINLMPSSIVSLQLPHGDCYSHMSLEKELINLVELKKLQPGQFPKLQQIICDIEHEFDDSTVANMCAAAGIDFEYGSWPRSRRITHPPIENP
ncbi:hypothetical protein G7Z17_g1079 [Cylindrodendrum hubeiense]|uniref:F-box domain-containing protein n=1 Tax=Cylindrodendrum hubeiense TaxID=595255 RepID=A0A9P5LFQ0_9HYPO|nr:hypothetical protein G7Z17_g1079 [Cylindrodendrum hubeiense]